MENKDAMPFLLMASGVCMCVREGESTGIRV